MAMKLLCALARSALWLAFGATIPFMLLGLLCEAGILWLEEFDR